MVKVSKITVTEHNYDELFKKPDDSMKKCLELISAKELQDLLPKNTRHIMRFKLEDANSQLANAIRRCLVDELPTYSMTFNLMYDSAGKPADFITDLRTNDKHIFGKCDYLKKRIEGIPIKQNINPDEWKITLEVQNNTSDLIDITSAHFKVLHKGKPVSTDSLMFPNYIIMRIYPKCSLKISNIYIVEGIGMVNANSFKYITNIYYEIEDEPMKRIDNKYVGKSSMVSDYKIFTMGYATYRNGVAAHEPIKRACQVLVDRLKLISAEWDKIKSDEPSDKLQVNKVGESFVISMQGETYTLANLVYYYVFQEMPTIEFASGGVHHMDKIGGVVIIKNNNYIKLFSNAIDAAIKDLQKIQSAF